MLDEAGLEDCKITASNSLDEYLVRSLLDQGAQIDSFGIGENMIVSKSAPVFGGVYKLVAVENEQGIEAKIKISENTEKITNPGYKRLYRLYDRSSGQALADLIALHDEVIDGQDDVTIYHQSNLWKFKKIEKETYDVEELQVPIYSDGKLVYDLPDIETIRVHSIEAQAKMWVEIYRLEYPHLYYVDLTEKLLNTKMTLLKKNRQ